MACLKTLQVSGAAVLGPPQATCGSAFSAGSDVVSLGLTQNPQAAKPGCRNINSPSTWVDLLADSGIGVARFVLLRASGGTLEVRFTTTAGVDQVADLTDLFLLSNPLAGYGVTALAVRGSADLEMLITGDP